MNTNIAKAAHIDVSIVRTGTLFLFTPYTPEAKTWIELHVQEPTWYGQSLVVEHRYAVDLARGMLSDGLKVE